MITLNSGATNSVTLRFHDNIVGTNSIYLFEFECIQSGEKFYCTPIDTSPTTRYNQFTIREISDTGLTASLTASVPYLELSYGGYYNYKVYETDNYSLSPTGSNVLDYGKMLFVNGEYSTFFFEVNDDETINVFDYYEEIKEFDTPIPTFPVFDYWTETKEFDTIYSPVAIFDPEHVFRVLTTEVYAEAIKTEEGFTLSW